MPAEEILKLAEWVLANEPNRKASSDWSKNAERIIRQEAGKVGLELRDFQISLITSHVVENRDRLLISADVVDIADSGKLKT